NSVGAKKIYRFLNGSPVQLSSSNVSAGEVSLLRYDSALDGGSGGFLLLNFLGRAPLDGRPPTTADINLNTYVTYGATGLSGTPTNAPPGGISSGHYQILGGLGTSNIFGILYNLVNGEIWTRRGTTGSGFSSQWARVM